MTILNYACFGSAITALFIAGVTILLYRKNVHKTMKTMDHMIEAAISGEFSEHVFDESVISAVEAKLAQFLSICSVSSKNLLAEKNKINELISDISHQTKTPIANILLYSQLLSEYDLPPEGSTCVKALSTQAEKLHFLIHSLLKTSRLETGIIKLSSRQESVQRLLTTALEQIMPKANAKGMSITMESKEIQASFDLKWTVEAIYNILDNAVKYTEMSGNIFIRVSAYDLFCRIDITDNGIGIAEEEHSKIFKRFYRSQTVISQEGVGIGLFLAREIVSAGGGYIKLWSRRGSGSTFSIFLPIDK
ncbi:sensor histidine kinase [Paenibacillus polymyxa]|uniref:sensor histidine kinase n=1 Tax=Paenibacillus TaxID=44249 RepID=UPI000E3DEF5E|nr:MULTISPECIES: HAMP domain-containing sensor histidine kinase [Paenibacillus]KAF6654644.1 HAMP domain-containing histidine kinase [Paenibacillus sp. EKM301P]RFT95605.1 sensor histidine kinase [Paenibacillus jamilae]RPD99441.1 sensor histidine kinase [Paenibacillus polymyxa]UBS86621.1 HAMP domain-containing histidine kinase [Paenibacillus polymyxa]UQQ34678.1 HAMP domain-containing histidine kinase [Paenibacillus polymyxa]